MSLKNTLSHLAFTLYAKFKYHPSRWYWLNKNAVSKFKNSTPELTDVQQKVLSELRENGIATVSIGDLTRDHNLLTDLKNYALSRQNTAKAHHKKKFLINYWEENVKLDLSNPYLKLALSPAIIDVANTYMGMYTELVFNNLQKTIPTTERTHSRNWHRDPQEYSIVKVFLYLSDVDDEAGPFTYVPKSAPGYKPYGDLFPQQVPEGSYPGNEALEAAIPKEDIKPQTGPAGTLIFCNTNGLHYGGVTKSKERIMFTMSYAAPTYKDSQGYHFDADFLKSIAELPQQSQFAIRKQWQIK